MSFTPLEYLRHIHAECDFLVTQTRTHSKGTFLQDGVLQRAFVRSIGVIGEAARRVPVEFTSRYPQVNWRVITGMRDRLIHGYFAIDYDIVWNVATHEAAILMGHIEEILRSEAE